MFLSSISKFYSLCDIFQLLNYMFKTFFKVLLKYNNYKQQNLYFLRLSKLNGVIFLSKKENPQLCSLIIIILNTLLLANELLQDTDIGHFSKFYLNQLSWTVD